MKISVIGAGLGGLSAACLLSARGHRVTVFEKNDKSGGKMNEISGKGFRFDTGPSLLTMPFVLEKLFRECGTQMDHYLELKVLNLICSYFYKDGTVFNNFENRDDTLDELKRIAPEDVKAYRKFLDYSESLYQKTTDAFIFNPLYDFQDFRQLDWLSFFGIDAFTTVSKRVDSYFQSPYMRKFFKRFTTYNGSSPFQAPGTLNVIPHVELNMGGYYVKGGLYKVAEALEELAISQGVKFRYGNEVSQVLVSGTNAKGLQLHTGEQVLSDVVLSNSDATETITRLLPPESISPRKKQKAEAIEPSCSGYVLMLGIDQQYEQLGHHNIFFTEDYEREFRQIFKEKVMPDDPTIYIANTSFTDTGHAPEGGSNLFILVNAPYLSEAYSWQKHAAEYGDKIIRELEKRGLHNLGRHIRFRKHITPKDFYEHYRSNKGSIYGTSSNSKTAAFVRPRNKSRDIEKLYFVGGSTHPGGGIPLVVQSAFNAVELMERYEFRG